MNGMNALRIWFAACFVGVFLSSGGITLGEDSDVLLPETEESGEFVRVQDVLDAREVLRGHLEETPCLYSYGLSRVTGAEVYIKLECFQATGSFKERGALNKIASLTEEQRRKGVIAASTGNHAQGVSFHARRLNIPATIIMPENTPVNKVQRTRALGARVILEGATFDEAVRYAQQLARDEELTLVHPYNDPKVIAGQGTAAIEMLEAIPELDTLIIPVGGGGLISGCSIAAKSIKPDIRIFGVESTAFSAMKQKLNNQPVEVGGATLAEAMAVKEVGLNPLELIRDRIEKILVVDEQHIEKAIVFLVENAKTVAEGAGATPLAALLQFPELFEGHHVGLMISGGNIDTYELAMVLMRGLVHSGRLVQYLIPVADNPDQMGHVSSIIDESGGVIREIRNNTIFGAAPIKSPEMVYTVETHHWEHAHELLEKLHDHDIQATLTKSMKW